MMMMMMVVVAAYCRYLRYGLFRSIGKARIQSVAAQEAKVQGWRSSQGHKGGLHEVVPKQIRGSYTEQGSVNLAGLPITGKHFFRVKCRVDF